MTEKPLDPEIEFLKGAWEPPPPNRDLQKRISWAYEREFGDARVWRGRLAVAASAVLAALLWFMLAARQKDAPARVGQSVPEPLRVSEPMQIPELPASHATPHVRRKLLWSRETTSSSEAVTQFFPLMDAPPPLGRGTLVRTLVPATMLQAAGLREWDDRLSGPIPADILIGEEGFPRAIRFVVVKK